MISKEAREGATTSPDAKKDEHDRTCETAEDSLIHLEETVPKGLLAA